MRGRIVRDRARGVRSTVQFWPLSMWKWSLIENSAMTVGKDPFDADEEDRRNDEDDSAAAGKPVALAGPGTEASSESSARRNPKSRNTFEGLGQGIGSCPDPTFLDCLSFARQCPVMAPLVADVNANRELDQSLLHL